MKETLDDLISEIQERLRLLNESLPHQIDLAALSRSKLPFKALAYREALIWRVVELGEVALESFNTEKFAAAILLTRATVETVAALWYLQNKMQAALKSKNIGDLDKYLMRLSLGWKSWDEEAPTDIEIPGL
jgi:hypothetical protein